MARTIQVPDSHGSLRDLQCLINERSSAIAEEIGRITGQPINIDWMSPLMNDAYAEYSDNDFIDILRLNKTLRFPLKNFWPSGGPHWDALGISDTGVILVEAKAHASELKSSCKATSSDSLMLINNSLKMVKSELGVSESADWLHPYYQYANRIAHLYYLRVINKIDARLVFLYFLNDRSVDGIDEISEWKQKIRQIKDCLGINHPHILDKYIYEIFISCKT